MVAVWFIWESALAGVKDMAAVYWYCSGISGMSFLMVHSWWLLSLKWKTVVLKCQQRIKLKQTPSNNLLQLVVSFLQTINSAFSHTDIPLFESLSCFDRANNESKLNDECFKKLCAKMLSAILIHFYLTLITNHEYLLRTKIKNIGRLCWFISPNALTKVSVDREISIFTNTRFVANNILVVAKFPMVLGHIF